MLLAHVLLASDRSQPALPALTFERNEGQADGQAQFLARYRGSQLHLSATALEFRGRNGSLRMDWLGATHTGGFAGSQPAGLTSSYHLGRDSRRWVNGAPSYARLERSNLYPNIDWMVYGHVGELEYDLILKPGADPTAIRLRIAGASRVELDAGGALHMETPGGTVTQRAPQSFQRLPDGAMVKVDSHFVALGNSEFGLTLGAYRPELAVTVDPVLSAAFVSGLESDDRIVLHTDTFTVGVSRGISWRDGPDSTGNDIYVKTQFGIFIWGGSGNENPAATAVSSALYVYGSTDSRDFPTTPDAGQSQYGGGATDGFVIRASVTGVDFSTLLGGDGGDDIRAVQPLAAGLLVAGRSDSRTFSGAQTRVAGQTGGMNAMVAMLSAEPHVLLAGGSRMDEATALIQLTASGEIVIAGETDSPDFPLVDPTVSNFKGGTDVWYGRLRIEDDFPVLLESALWGGSGSDRATALIQLSGFGVVLAGNTTSPDLPLKKPAQPRIGGGQDIFLVRFTTDLRTVVRSTYYGGSADDEVASIAAVNTDLFVAGWTNSRDLPGKPDPLTVKAGGGKQDGFVAQLDSFGRPVWHTTIGGTEDDRVLGMSITPSSTPGMAGLEIRLGGETQSSDFGRALVAGTNFIGSEGFHLTTSYSLVTATEAVAGRNLRGTLQFRLWTNSSRANVLKFRSSDPSKLLLSRLFEQPVEQITVSASESSTIDLLALVDGEDVDVIVSGDSIAERRVPVRLASSRYSCGATAPVQRVVPVGGVLSFGFPLIMVDPDTGQLKPNQSIGNGLTRDFRVASADQSALRPRFASDRLDPAAPSQFEFDALRIGTYRMDCSSFLFLPLDGTASSEVTVYVLEDAAFLPRAYYLGAGTEVAIQSVWGARYSVKDGRVLRIASGTDGSGIINGPLRLAGLQPGQTEIVMEYPGRQEVTFPVMVAPIEIVLPSTMQVPVGSSFGIAPSFRILGTAPAGFQSLQPLSFAAAVDAGSLPRGEDGPVQLIQSTNRPDFSFRALRPGVAELRFEFPGFVTARVNAVRVEVAAPMIRFSNPEFHAASGVRSQLVLERAGLTASKRVVVRTDDAGIADLGLGGAVEVTAAGGIFEVNGRGQVGQSTMLRVYLDDVLMSEAKVTIVPAFLIPEDPDLQLRGERYINMRPALVLPDGKVDQSRRSLSSGVPAPAIEILNEAPGACEFGPAPFPQLLIRANCQGEGVTYYRAKASELFVETPPAFRSRIVSAGDTITRIVGVLPQQVLLGNGVQAPLRLHSAAKRVTSADPSKVRVSLSPNEAGQESVSNAVGSAWLQGYASEGRTRILVEHTDGSKSEAEVFLFRSGLGFRNLSRRTVPAGGPYQLEIQPVLVTPEGEGFPANLYFIPTPGIPVRLASSNPMVADEDIAWPLQSALPDSVATWYRAKAPGFAEMRVVQPPGFVENSRGRMAVHVEGSRFQPPARITLSRGLQQLVHVAPGMPASGLVVESLDPNRAIVAREVTHSGQTRLELGNQNTVYVQALAEENAPPARIRFSAPGFEDAVMLVDFGTTMISVSNFGREYAPESAESLRFTATPHVRGVPIPSWGGAAMPGFRVRLRVTSSNPLAAAIAWAGEAVIAGPAIESVLAFRTLRPGTARFTITPDSLTAVPVRLTGGNEVRVRNWQFTQTVRSYPLRFLVGEVEIKTSHPETVTATARIAAGATISTSASSAGASSVTFDIGRAKPVSLFVHATVADTDIPYTISGPEHDDRTSLHRPGAAVANIRPMGRRALSEGRIDLAFVITESLALAYGLGLSPAAGPQTFRVRSSNPAVARPVTEEFVLLPGEWQKSIPVELLSKGTATFTLEAPAAFSAPGFVPASELIVE